MENMKKRAITAEDLYLLTSVNDPQMSPDGKKAAYVRTMICDKENRYKSNIYILDIVNGTKTQWTFGAGKDYHPRWSPDGSKLLFLSDRKGKTELYVMQSQGGEARKLPLKFAGVSEPIWSPDGSSILVTVFGEEERNAAIDEPLLVKNISYKSDAHGFLRDRKKQLILISEGTEEAEAVTDGVYNCYSGVFSPDGSRIAYLSDKREDETSPLTDIYERSLPDKNTINITKGTGVYSSISYSPDGTYMSFTGHQQKKKGATLNRIWLYRFSDSVLFELSAQLDIYIGDAAVTDFLYGTPPSLIQWTADSAGFYFLASDQGSTHLYYGSPDGYLFPVRSEEEHIYAFSVHPSTHTAIAAISSPVSPCQLYFLNFAMGNSQQMTQINDQFLRDAAVSKPEKFSFAGAAEQEVHGWVLKPSAMEEGKKYPFLLYIHGGPHAMYGNTYFHEFQMLAASGFGVLYVNPRGSHGYGQEFADLVRGDYGGNDYHDVMGAVDYAIEHYSCIDSDRLGAAGGSYGGFMTNWIIGQTNRFKAAVTQRSISNWISFFGTSDIGYYFTEGEVGWNPFEEAEKLWERSPLKYVKQMETPLLILHSEKDYRCPIEQAEQLYTALKYYGKTAEFMRFPEANHDLSRNGDLKLRIQRLHAIRDWFHRYL
ncbi:prolyl oligopeptidase family serine peptidase [Bacillus lacus]|uniref:Prolyl oligopeptidase family serine peptidase n=1 Tax=Metabacillus lacus TaxID=1983721 RepID=A0A7X2M0T4_9BACI|nr:S9 family peptidase [Metabacillus lacus]MRX73219.1 prolyl oligopeptidase family serine peptidase [Metabacillus lacus]